MDKGVENVLVCYAMVQARAEGRGSFIASPHTTIKIIIYFTYKAQISIGLFLFAPRINNSHD